MNCPICKSANETNNIFCIVCGIKIRNVDFINNLDFEYQKVETSQNSSSLIQIKNSTVHGGISLNGTANGKDESINVRSKSLGSKAQCPACGKEVEANEKFCLECGVKL